MFSAAVGRVACFERCKITFISLLKINVSRIYGRESDVYLTPREKSAGFTGGLFYVYGPFNRSAEV